MSVTVLLLFAVFVGVNVSDVVVVVVGGGGGVDVVGAVAAAIVVVVAEYDVNCI